MRTFFSGLYTVSGDYRSSAPGGSAKGPSSRLTVAVVFQGPEQFRAKVYEGPFYDQGPMAVSGQKCMRTTSESRRPDAVSPQKCTRPPSETGDLEQFHGKSACGLVKILRCAQDDSVGAWIGVILKGAAGRLHARSARRWGSLGPCPKVAVFRHEGPVFHGVVPERGGFQAWYRLHSALPSPSVQS